MLRFYAMGQNKTVPTKASVSAFLKNVEDPVQQEDCYTAMALMQELTGEQPVMWGPSIVGFGSYHYHYDSGREGDMLLVGFSPRKGKLVFYIGANSEQNKPLLDNLGKYQSGKSCLYIKRLADVDIDVLGQIITTTYKHLNTTHNSKTNSIQP